MCLYNATIVKADFKTKKYWKTFYTDNGQVNSAVFGQEYKRGWNYSNPEVTHLTTAGIHCFDNYEDAKKYRDKWHIPNEVICPVYALGSDIIATGETDGGTGFTECPVPSTTFKKVFIRKKDWEQIIKGESVHD